ncbi:hypothetical protein T4E_7163 [Trichinella pseudospiralis]|uniref:Uncharacterized protein n=1 Tax=Trichinella pseudospiralis TaxID=6337 RepID=A0A0V0YE38_TRIPS|nr:hypothetical protein T4E_7163 [Trichinella pseudospiralis]
MASTENTMVGGRSGIRGSNDTRSGHFDMKMRGFQGLNNSRSKWLERDRREYGAEMTLSQGGWMGWQASIRGINDTAEGGWIWGYSEWRAGIRRLNDTLRIVRRWQASIRGLNNTLSGEWQAGTGRLNDTLRVVGDADRWVYGV